MTRQNSFSGQLTTEIPLEKRIDRNDRPYYRQHVRASALSVNLDDVVLRVFVYRDGAKLIISPYTEPPEPPAPRKDEDEDIEELIDEEPTD